MRGTRRLCRVSLMLRIFHFENWHNKFGLKLNKHCRNLFGVQKYKNLWHEDIDDLIRIAKRTMLLNGDAIISFWTELQSGYFRRVDAILGAIVSSVCSGCSADWQYGRLCLLKRFFLNRISKSYAKCFHDSAAPLYIVSFYWNQNNQVRYIN